ncbi:LysR family transcriptional regulator [Alcaligenaceae bacterium]|nr:LysR family transcriptional regulator [Alcaligenaceae bacterium]
MELKQLRYLVRVAELGSINRAAGEIGIAPSALSRQISNLESELSTLLLQRTSSGVTLTHAGTAFMRQAHLTLRHADAAVLAAQSSRIVGQVSVGLLPSVSTVVGLPFIEEMRRRYPRIQVKVAESLSTSLSVMLNTRQIDIAVHVEEFVSTRWHAMPLLDERLFLFGRPDMPGFPCGKHVKISQLSGLPLILPGQTHGLREHVNKLYTEVGNQLHVVQEINGLDLLMELTSTGIAASIHPGSAMRRATALGMSSVELVDEQAFRRIYLASLSESELSSCALAARTVMDQTIEHLVASGRWPGASLLPRLDR